jgi:hypothetical protein
MWLAPLLVVAVVGLGWRQIGVAILAGVAVNIIILPLQLVFGKWFGQ